VIWIIKEYSTQLKINLEQNINSYSPGILMEEKCRNAICTTEFNRIVIDRIMCSLYDVLHFSTILKDIEHWVSHTNAWC